MTERQDKTRPAGGFATQRGINYQNRVAAYFSACCLAERAAIPGLPGALIESIRCETGEPLADILLGLENGGLVFIEVKRAIHLNSTQMKPVVSQLIQQLLLSEQGTSGGKFPWRRTLDPDRDRFLLITSSDSPEVVTKHLAACLSRFGSPARAEDIASVPQNDAEARAFTEFHALVLQTWKDLIGIEPVLEKVTRLCALFRIGVLDVNPSEADEQHGQSFLANSVVSNSDDSSRAWSKLVEMMGVTSEARQAVSRQDLRRGLLSAGFRLTSTAGYMPDIRSLREYTRLTLESLNHLAILVMNGRPVRIERPVTAYLRAQSGSQSLVVLGDPGAGKSGVLHELGSALRKDDEDVVFIAADRVEGSLKAELGLNHDLGDVLENWSGERPGLLIIDALDAARGSTALLVLRELIRRVVKTKGSRWRVVASIRVFDLRYSQDLQSIFHVSTGEPSLAEFQDPTFFNLRHIKVPCFSPSELHDIRTKAPELNRVFDTASRSLLELLGIPFNLRLVVEMLSSDQKHENFSGIETQVGLLNRYWLHRVIRSAAEGSARELVLLDVLRALVKERRLTVSKARVREAAATSEFASLCSDNVLVEQIANLHGRYIIGFSHHLLFDYAASRLLVAMDFAPFLENLAAERDLSLFLRPSIDLFFKQSWLENRTDFWSFLRQFSEHKGIPAIAKIIGPAVIPELARNDYELLPLTAHLSARDRKTTDIAEQWVIHAVGAVLAGVPITSLSLWSSFCNQLASSKSSLRVAAVCQTLIDHLLAQMNGGAPNTFEGRIALSHASVILLNRFLEMNPRDPWLMARTIGNVMDLFSVNRDESAAVLRKLITSDEVRNKGAEQGPWIARKVPLLFDVDPRLAADIYIAFFGYEEDSEETTSMGGSRILAMTSNRRQDYHQTQWQLAQYFPRFLEKNFTLCADIVLAAVNDYIDRDHRPRDRENLITYRVGERDHSVLTDYSAIWDGSTIRDDVLNITDTYFRKLGELAKSADTLSLAKATATDFLLVARYAYVPRKILKCAAETGAEMAQTVYPLLVSESALLSFDLSSLIGDALRTVTSGLSKEQRKAIELALHRLPEGEVGDAAVPRAERRDSLLGCIPIELLTLPQSIARMQELSTSGGAPENRPPYISHGIRMSPDSELERMRERGIPVDAEPNASLRAVANRLWDFASRFNNSVPKSSDVATIQGDVTVVRDALLANGPGLHPDIKNSAEAQLLAACATAAKSKEFDCADRFGRTVMDILFAGLDSPAPEYRVESNAQFDRSPAWGAPIQRIEASAGIGNLLARKKCVDENVLANVRRALVDPDPAVRFQIATRLLPLHDTHLASLWIILREFAATEMSTGVLSGALYAVINPMSGRYKTEVVDLIRIILAREGLPNEGGDAFEWCYRIATGIYLWQNDDAAYAVVRRAVENDTFLPRRAGQCLIDIRGTVTFSSDVPKASDALVRQRSFGLIEQIIASASVKMNGLLHAVEPKDRNAQWQENFQELAHLIDYIGNQLYFSSGAYDGTDSNKKLVEDARRVFWKESQGAITGLSSVAIPSVAHHLIETLQSFIHFDPAEVFHAISKVVGSAASWGYQYESMAVDLLVKVTERYLAEHRSLLQQDLRCREELIDILETFVSAGWPSARGLSYRLEEIFR